MANEKDKATPAIDGKAIVEALKSLPADELKGLLTSAGLAPSTMGMTPEHLQVLMGTLTTVSADAQKKALRENRKENPQYPEKSVFFPAGRFDDMGNPLPAKVKFDIPTFFMDVRLAGELEEEIEIKLCNQLAAACIASGAPKLARDGAWSAEVDGVGRNRRLLIRVGPPGHKLSIDDRMVLPDFPSILRELLDGPTAVNATSLHTQIEAMAKRIAELEKVGAVA